jgi:predicted permease
MISNSFTFALGPKFLDCPDDIEASSPKDPMNEQEDAEALEQQQEDAVQTNEQTSLLPQSTARTATRTSYSLLARCQTAFAHLPTFVQQTLSFLAMFLNPPFIGTCIGVLIGLVPARHTLFFSDQQHGGYLNAWLTAALQNVGDLFAALQVIVVGIKLSSSLLKWKKGEASGTMPWGPWALVTFVRFILWPAIAIPVVYGFATKTRLLDEEPILWFAMMLMPTGPPALSITAMADVSGADEEQKLSIAKFLTVSSRTSSPVDPCLLSLAAKKELLTFLLSLKRRYPTPSRH